MILHTLYTNFGKGFLKNEETIEHVLVLVFAIGLITPMTIDDVYAAGGVVMTVNGTSYSEHGTGWSAAVKLASGGTETTVKLFADWEADVGGFVCPDGGTKDGALYVNSGKITGGYAQDGGGVYSKDCILTINGGTITGNKAKSYGGGVYSYGAQSHLNGGRLCNSRL